MDVKDLNFSAAVRDLDISLRFGLFVLNHVLVYYWMRMVVAPAAPGAARIVRSLPVIPFLWVFNCLFRGDVPEEYMAAIYCSMNFLWLTPSKIWSFCLNRGQLVKSYETGSTAAFVLALLFPVTVAFDEKPFAKHKDHAGSKTQAYEDVQFSVVRLTGRDYYMETGQIVLRLVSKVGFLMLLEYGYRHFGASRHLFLRDLCLSWFVYANTSLIEDLTCFIILLLLNLKLGTNFDCPWLSQSVRELWSSRYNLVFGQTLRDLVYDPISQGSWMANSKYFEKRKSSTFRRCVALASTFVASSVLHVFTLMQALKIEIPILYSTFFPAHALFILLEDLIRAFLKRKGVYAKLSSSIPFVVYNLYVMVVVFSLAHFLFWPELIENGYAEAIVSGALFLKKS